MKERKQSGFELVDELREFNLDDEQRDQAAEKKQKKPGKREQKRQEKQQQKQRQKQEKQAKKRKKATNKEFARITYAFVALFLVMLVYIGYFYVVRSKDLLTSAYNTRQESLADRVIRGKILDKDGNTLAETKVSSDGTETRSYPYGKIFAQVVGYSSKGRTGLESVQNYQLLTSDSFILEKVFRELKGEKNYGDSIVTTLDAKLQSAAYDALGDNKGAVVIMEPSTGKVLAMVSKPSYDPNSILENWDTLNSDEENTPLLNRATQGLYTPGSTFKIATTLDYIREKTNYSNYTYNCSGEITESGLTIHCYNSTVHGTENLVSSFANSCNSSFVNIGISLNKSIFAETCKDLLFNKTLPGDFASSKSQMNITKSSTTSDMMMTAIGQGETLVSPYHMCLIASAIANKGTLMKPYLVDHIQNAAGNEITTVEPEEYGDLMTSSEAATLTECMKAVVSSGTGSSLSGAGYSVAGKTGTAEYSTDKDKTHSWFVGFSNTDNPDLAFSVIVEGSDGGTKAVSVVKTILDSYY